MQQKFGIDLCSLNKVAPILLKTRWIQSAKLIEKCMKFMKSSAIKEVLTDIEKKISSQSSPRANLPKRFQKVIESCHQTVHMEIFPADPPKLSLSADKGH